MTILRRQQGFTLVEMITVIVLTGIIGGIVAMFMRAPVQGYVDSARRAELTDIADTALRRFSRDLRLALPNSVRVAGVCSGTTACFIEFIPTIGGGRYRDSITGAGAGNILDFSAADTGFDVLGAMPPVAIGDQIVVYNLGIAGADAYAGNTLATHNRRAVSAVAAGSITITSANKLPFDSCAYDASGFVVGGCRFQVVQTPVTYACDPATGTLWRYSGYAIQDVQTKTDTVAKLDALAGVVKAPMATNVSTTDVNGCRFTYDASVVAQRSGLVTMHLTITEQGENVSLYGATHVSNVP